MDTSVKPFPEDDLVIVPDVVGALVGMIDKGDSMDAIYEYLCVSELGKSVGDPNHWVGSNDLRVLFHTLSREMLRSLLLMHLGPDLYDRDEKKDNWERVLHPHGAGCYVCFIYIDGREGKFLSSDEIVSVIRDLRKYARAVNLFQKYMYDEDLYLASQDVSDEDREDLLFAMEVDDVTKVKPANNLDDPVFSAFVPRFRSKNNEQQVINKKPGVKLSENVTKLIRMLKKRRRTGPGSDVVQRQSPLMVGNSARIGSRVENHMIGSTLGNSPHIWALLLSCLTVQGYEVRTGHATLFRTWENDKQMNQAELLGTILAQSMVHRHGMNVKIPGTRSDFGAQTPNAFGDSERHVFVGKPWFRENLEHSIQTSPGELEKKRLETLKASLQSNANVLGISRERAAEKEKAFQEATAETERLTKIAKENVNEGKQVLREMKQKGDVARAFLGLR